MAAIEVGGSGVLAPDCGPFSSAALVTGVSLPYWSVHQPHNRCHQRGLRAAVFGSYDAFSG